MLSTSCAISPWNEILSIYLLFIAYASVSVKKISRTVKFNAFVKRVITRFTPEINKNQRKTHALNLLAIAAFKKSIGTVKHISIL